jgi:hypothetical protein
LKSLDAWARAEGIPKTTLYHRVVVRGLSMAEALALGPSTRRKRQIRSERPPIDCETGLKVSVDSASPNGRNDIPAADSTPQIPAEIADISARHRGFEPLTYGSGGMRKYPENHGKSSHRDGLVTAIVGALSSAAAREPQALSRCVEALGLVLGALIESAGEDVTGADDERGCGDALPSHA